MKTLSLSQAARRVGKSKTAISRAIQEGRLNARRAANGHYEIDPADLLRAFPPADQTQQNAVSIGPAELPAAEAETTEDVAALETAIADQPLATAIADQPLATAIADQPLAAAIADQPLETAIADQPSEAAKANQPLAAAIADQPLATAIADQPLATAIADQPLAAAIADQPLATAIADQPLATAIADQPLAAAIADQPLATAIADQPLQAAIAAKADQPQSPIDVKLGAKYSELASRPVQPLKDASSLRNRFFNVADPLRQDAEKLVRCAREFVTARFSKKLTLS